MSSNKSETYSVRFVRETVMHLRGYGLMRFKVGDPGELTAQETRFVLLERHAVLDNKGD